MTHFVVAAKQEVHSINHPGKLSLQSSHKQSHYLKKDNIQSLNNFNQQSFNVTALTIYISTQVMMIAEITLVKEK